MSGLAMNGCVQYKQAALSNCHLHFGGFSHQRSHDFTAMKFLQKLNIIEQQLDPVCSGDFFFRCCCQDDIERQVISIKKINECCDQGNQRATGIIATQANDASFYFCWGKGVRCIAFCGLYRIMVGVQEDAFFRRVKIFIQGINIVDQSACANAIFLEVLLNQVCHLLFFPAQGGYGNHFLEKINCAIGDVLFG